MSEVKFTDGEWYISGVGDSTYIDSETGFTIAEVLDLRPDIANAHLMKVSPKMYKMLEVINDMIMYSNTEVELANNVTGLCHDINCLLEEARGNKQ
jgi:hypothetical protein